MPKESFFAARRCKKIFFYAADILTDIFLTRDKYFILFARRRLKSARLPASGKKFLADTSSRPPQNRKNRRTHAMPKNQSSHKRKNALAKRNKKHKRRLTKIPLKFNCPNSPPQSKIRAITRLRQKFPQTPAPAPPQNRKNRRACAIVIKFTRPQKREQRAERKRFRLSASQLPMSALRKTRNLTLAK